MEFVQDFTPPDFQAKNFTPPISPNFNSFIKKKQQQWVKMEKLTLLANILHCRRHWRRGQIPPLVRGARWRFIEEFQFNLKQALNDPGSILSPYSSPAPLPLTAPSWVPADETRPWLQWKPHRPASSMNAAVIELNSWIKSCWTVLELTPVQYIIWVSWVLSTFWPWQR